LEQRSEAKGRSMTMPLTQYDQMIRDLAAEAVDAATKAGLRKGTYAFGNFIAGQWKVMLGERPHLVNHKIAFLDVVGGSK
jgi:hypothetical protein